MIRTPLLIASALTLAACAAQPPQDRPATTPETVEAEPAPPPKPKVTSAQLLGQDGPWVKLKLGQPAFMRNEKTANIWQYKNGACVLNVFLYVEGDTETAPRVLHFDARDGHGHNTDRDQCLAAIQN